MNLRGRRHIESGSHVDLYFESSSVNRSTNQNQGNQPTKTGLNNARKVTNIEDFSSSDETSDGDIEKMVSSINNI